MEAGIPEDWVRTAQRIPTKMHERFCPGYLTEDGNWKLHREIGRGNYAVVFSAVNLRTGKLFALKIYNTPDYLRCTRGELKYLQRKCEDEIDCLKAMQYSDGYFPKFYDELVEEDSYTILVTDLVHGRRSENEECRRAMTFSTLMSITHDVVQTVYSMHMVGVVHRNINPRAILLRTGGSRAPHCSKAVLTGWGWARQLSEMSPTEKFFGGTILFHAPEIYRSGEEGLNRGKAADIWAIGAILYDFVGGSPLLNQYIKGLGDRRAEDVRKSELDGKFQEFLQGLTDGWMTFPTQVKENYPQVVSFIEGCCRINPAERFTAGDALDHDVLTQARICRQTWNVATGTPVLQPHWEDKSYQENGHYPWTEYEEEPKVEPQPVDKQHEAAMDALSAIFGQSLDLVPETSGDEPTAAPEDQMDAVRTTTSAPRAPQKRHAARAQMKDGSCQTGPAPEDTTQEQVEVVRRQAEGIYNEAKQEIDKLRGEVASLNAGITTMTESHAELVGRLQREINSFVDEINSLKAQADKKDEATNQLLGKIQQQEELIAGQAVTIKRQEEEIRIQEIQNTSTTQQAESITAQAHRITQQEAQLNHLSEEMTRFQAHAQQVVLEREQTIARQAQEIETHLGMIHDRAQAASSQAADILGFTERNGLLEGRITALESQAELQAAEISGLLENIESLTGKITSQRGQIEVRDKTILGQGDQLRLHAGRIAAEAALRARLEAHLAANQAQTTEDSSPEPETTMPSTTAAPLPHSPSKAQQPKPPTTPAGRGAIPRGAARKGKGLANGTSAPKGVAKVHQTRAAVKLQRARAEAVAAMMEARLSEQEAGQVACLDAESEATLGAYWAKQRDGGGGLVVADNARVAGSAASPAPPDVPIAAAAALVLPAATTLAASASSAAASAAMSPVVTPAVSPPVSPPAPPEVSPPVPSPARRLVTPTVIPGTPRIGRADRAVNPLANTRRTEVASRDIYHGPTTRASARDAAGRINNDAVLTPRRAPSTRAGKRKPAKGKR